jgi:hypothetical protein
MNKYNYSKSNLANKYKLVTESYFQEIKKEQINPEHWDENLNHPKVYCFEEDGTLKKECMQGYAEPAVPENTDGTDGGVAGNIAAEPGYAGSQGGKSLSETTDHVAKIKECMDILENHCAGWCASGHEAAPMALETVQRLKEFVNECSY